MEIIAHIRTDFPEKFGIPRQSGLAEALEGKIIFTKKYRLPEAVRGLEEFSHIWLLWKFSKNETEAWSPTVRPPRLGGKKRIGVFATRSPFRPNPIGLSCVRLEKIIYDEKEGPVLCVRGADLMDQTPIYDIKPYIPYTDCHTEALEGYTKASKRHLLSVNFPEELRSYYPKEKQEAVLQLLAQDPRPAYVQMPQRVYGITFGGYDIKFQVQGDTLFVLDVLKRKEQ